MRTCLVAGFATPDNMTRALGWLDVDSTESVRLLGYCAARGFAEEHRQEFDSLSFYEHLPAPHANDGMLDNGCDVLVVLTPAPGDLSLKALLMLAARYDIPQVIFWPKAEGEPRVLGSNGIRLRLARFLFKEGWSRLLAGLSGDTASKTPPRTRMVELFEPLAGRIQHKGKGKGDFDISPLGFVQTVPPQKTTSLDPTDRKRIILLGGSSMYGVGLSGNEETIASRLFELLDEVDMDCEVLNYGVTGVSSAGESRHLLYRLIHAQPDVVISLSGWNDFVTRFGVQYYYGPGSDVLNWTFHDYHYYMLVHAPYEAGRFETPFADKELVRNFFPFLDTDAFPDSGEGLRNDLWFNNMQLMEQACRARNIAFHGILQPHALSQAAIPREIHIGNIRKNIDFFPLKHLANAELLALYEENIKTIYAQYSQLIKDHAAPGENSAISDWSNLFASQEEPCFVDMIHYSRTGASLLAAHLRDLILPELQASQEVHS